MKDKRTYTHLKEHGEDMTHENESKTKLSEDRDPGDLSLLVEMHKKEIWEWKQKESEWIRTENLLSGTKKIIDEMGAKIIQQTGVIKALEHDNEVYKNDDFKNWTDEWEKRLKLNNSSDKHLELMKETNPVVIPRNQKVEEALADADKGNLETMNKLLKVLNNPYSDQENIIEFQKPSPTGNEKYQTFCGT